MALTKPPLSMLTAEGTADDVLTVGADNSLTTSSSSATKPIYPIDGGFDDRSGTFTLKLSDGSELNIGGMPTTSSLGTGQPGLPGDDGRDGRDGINGKDGKDGIAGACGPQGEQGPPGPPGEQGPIGLVGPQGPQGQVGPPGPDGPEGPPGPDGPEGPQGQEGPQGIQGPEGIQGPPGPQGPQGEKGDIGPMGPDGVSGIDGLPGPPGPSNAILLKDITIDSGTFYSVPPDRFASVSDINAVGVEVRVLDTTTGSSTLNMKVNAEAVSTIAFTDTEIRIYNDYTTALIFDILIRL